MAADEPPPIALPDYYVIPPALLEKWTKLPFQRPVTAALTRHDIDLLILGMLKSFQSQEQLQRCMIAWSQGKIPEANAFLAEAGRLTIEGQNQVRQFLASLIASVVHE